MSASAQVLGSIINSADSAIATPSQDVVAVYDQNYNQLFSGARPLKARINPKAELMKHPIETGATIGDHRVFQPIEFEMNMIFEPDEYYVNYQSVKGAFESNSLLIVQTRVDTFSNIAISAMPHEESAEFADTITMILSLQQVTIVSAQGKTLSQDQVQNKTDAATVNKGSQQGTEATEAQQDSMKNSTLYNWFFGGKSTSTTGE